MKQGENFDMTSRVPESLFSQNSLDETLCYCFNPVKPQKRPTLIFSKECQYINKIQGDETE